MKVEELASAFGNKFAGMSAALEQYESALVAYSGGVDSTLVLKVASEIIGAEKVVGVLAVSPSLPARERVEARRIAEELSLRLVEVKTQELDSENYRANDLRRCFFCKEVVYSAIQRFASDHHFAVVLDGANADDSTDIRPGRSAAKNLGIVSPLYDFGLTKADVRKVARLLRLPNWNKPAAACLSSRVPYGSKISVERLAKVEAAETILHGYGISDCRVRDHGVVAVIEVPFEYADQVVGCRELALRVKQCGFTYVTLDLEGRRQGSMNEVLARGVAPREGMGVH